MTSWCSLTGCESVFMWHLPCQCSSYHHQKCFNVPKIRHLYEYFDILLSCWIISGGASANIWVPNYPLINSHLCTPCSTHPENQWTKKMTGQKLSWAWGVFNHDQPIKPSYQPFFNHSLKSFSEFSTVTSPHLRPAPGLAIISLWILRHAGSNSVKLPPTHRSIRSTTWTRD